MTPSSPGGSGGSCATTPSSSSRDPPRSAQGDEVAYEFRSGYRWVPARHLLAGQRLPPRLQVSQTQPPAALIYTTVNLPLAQPLILGLTRDEGSASALLVVLAYEPLPGV